MSPSKSSPVLCRARLQGGKSTKAFVLVSILFLLGLATLLVVTSTMLARVERKAAANTAKVEQARANALFALDVALNQLQREAGPDQRVTARADILDTSSTTPNTSNIKQPLWTGVWKSGSNGLDTVNSGNPQRQISLGSITPTMAQKIGSASWLVSGTSPVDPSTFTGSTNSPNAQAAVLAKIQTTSANTVEVLAPVVPMRSGTSITGAYAYWVSDEGVKAKVNMNDPTVGVDPGTDPSRNQLHFLAPQAAAAHKGSTEFGTTDLRANANLPKITTLQSLANLDGLSALSGTNSAKIAADFTTSSFGVLSDVRRGGLKKDLTAAFESSANFTTLSSSYGYGAQMLYRTASSAGLVVPAPSSNGQSPYYESVDQAGSNPAVDGISWFSLYTHYNAYKSSMSAPSALGTSGTTPSSSGNVSAAPNVASPRVYSISNSAGTVRTGSLIPTPVALRLDVALSSYQDASNNWKLRLHYFPQLVLHNPYAVRLSLNGFQFQRNVGAFSTAGKYSDLSLTVMRVISTTGATVTTGSWFMVNQAANGRFALKTKSGDCNSLEPGETRVFALDADKSGFATPADAITFSDLVSNPSMSADFSQQCDVLTGVNTSGSSTGSPYSTTDPSTIITVELKNPVLRMQNVDTFVLPNNLRWPQSDSSRITAGGASNLAAASGSWNALRIDQLTSPRRIIGFYIRQKGLLPSATTFTYSNAANNVPIYMGNYTALSPVDDNFSYAWREIYLSPFGGLYQNSQTDVNLFASGTFWQTSFGNESVGRAGAATRFVLRDVPNQPLVSLGQFMHMSATRYPNLTGDYTAYGTGSMFVGGSCPSPGIPTDYNALAQIFGVSSGSSQRTIYTDDSFLANEALFDRFYFSTVPPATLPAGTTYPATWTTFNAANSGSTLSDGSKPLLNSRLKPYYKNQSTAPLMADLRDVDKAAANLMLDGAFNINSTSVPAWKAFLGGLSGNDLRIYNAGLGSSRTESTTLGGSKAVAFSRFWSASGETAANTLWSGLRVLSDSELDDLAQKIVAEVKLRGPFLSVADFLNRRLGSNSNALSRCGALQAAIDKTSPNINSSAKAAGVTVNATVPTEVAAYPRSPNLITDNMKDANGVAWNTALGAPGYLMQQDIVQAIAPAIAARSDTFAIRTFGEVRNARTGETEARTWAEAVVQRLPDYLVTKTDNASSGNDPQETPSAGSLNEKFGRRFRIISFRWLNPNEI